MANENNIREFRKFKKGDLACFFDSYDNYIEGPITRFIPLDQTKGVPYLEVKGQFGTRMSKIQDCYPSKEACLEAAKKKHDERTAEYCDRIKTVEDLVRFLFDHDTTSEFRDYAAIEAAQTRAIDLLGIQLED